MGLSLEKRRQLYEAVARGFEGIASRHDGLSPAHRKALDKRVSREYFWHLAYEVLLPMRNYRECLALQKKAIRLDPWRLSYWKTYLVCRVRAALGSI